MTEIIGADRLARTLKAAASDLDHLQPTHGAVAALVAGRVRAPVRTGRLAGSITATGEPDAAVVSTGLVYAPPIEYGWPARNIAGARYLQRALEANTTSVIDRYRSELEQTIRTVKGA